MAKMIMVSSFSCYSSVHPSPQQAVSLTVSTRVTLSPITMTQLVIDGKVLHIIINDVATFIRFIN